MQEKDADREIAKLREKMAAGEPLTKDDLVPLALTPLMGGSMSLKDRILNAFEIVRESGESLGDRECVDKLEAVIYTMAEKFLEQVDMEDVRKGAAMTRLGKLLIEEGRVEGREEGQDRTNTLNIKLAELDRYNDIIRAAKDRPYQEELLREFGL